MSQNKAFSTPFILAVLCIYFSYFLHGISVITLAQNMTSLAEKFSTDNAGIAYLISGIGLGRLISILFFGVISDKFGRRAVILMAVIMYLLFFFGIPACPNLTLAYCLAVCVGIANSALDTGGYPALMECFPKASGSAVILVKAMVSFGQMFYPMLVSYMLLNNIWYGYGLIIPGILFVLITLMAAALAARDGELVNLSLIPDRLSVKGQKVLLTINTVLSVAFTAVLFKYGLDKVITQLENGKRTFVLNWPEWIFWSFVPIGAGCMILHLIEYCLDVCFGNKNDKEGK